MNPRPKLKFQWDTKYDQWTCNEFLSFKEGDIFSNSVLANHPELIRVKGFSQEKRKELINKYIIDYYAKHKRQIDKALTKAKKDWSNVKEQFFKLADRLFSDNLYTWPKGNYICYLSIFNCNPRFIKEKKFQAYYKHPLGINFVCIHKMLHFIFYDYLERNFLEQYKKLDERIVWKLSEVFNDVVLRTDEFVSLTKQKDPSIYAQSREELVRYQKMWEEAKENIDTFIKNYFSFLSEI